MITRFLRLFAIPGEYPDALPMDGFSGDEGYTWDDWHRDMQAKYPVRHFLSEELPTYLGRAKRVFWDDPIYYVVSHLHPRRRYHMLDIRSRHNGYDYGWMDRVEGLLYANFAMLVDFVEKEYPGHIDWEAPETDGAKAKDEFMALYKWWTEERPREHNEGAAKKSIIQRIHDAVFEDILRPTIGMGLGRVKGERSSQAELDRPGELTKKDDEMLHRLINVRHHLWT